MPIVLKSAYERPAPGDGVRILVDRLWPRGISRAAIDIDEWMKDVAPSDALRRGIHGGGLSWGEFRKGYLAELKGHRDTLRRLAHVAKKRRVTLVFSARDRKRNNATVLAQYLRMLGAG